jgi:hypothetical protein
VGDSLCGERHGETCRVLQSSVRDLAVILRRKYAESGYDGSGFVIGILGNRGRKFPHLAGWCACSERFRLERIEKWAILKRCVN